MSTGLPCAGSTVAPTSARSSSSSSSSSSRATASGTAAVAAETALPGEVDVSTTSLRTDGRTAQRAAEATAPRSTTRRRPDTPQRGGDGLPGTTASPHRPRSDDDAEELAQLARSLRSEIAGEAFLLTSAFSPVTRGPGGNGDRRWSSPLWPGLADPAAGAAESPAAVPPVATAPHRQRGPHVPPSLRIPSTAGETAEAARLPSPASASWQGNAQAVGGRSSSSTPSSSSPAAPGAAVGVDAPPLAAYPSPLLPAATAGDGAAACAEAEVDGLDNIAELRHRLLTEDFFSSPLRKFRRDGAFPWKLVTSVVLCALLVLQVTWYQLPLVRANESMRRAITEHFMGDDFASKGHGDIVAAPTAWMEGLYSSVERYVEVYYNLSNTSSSDMNYYAACPPNDGSAWAVNATAAASTCTNTSADTTAAVGLAFPSIAPVQMRLRVDAFSRREGVQHPDTASTALAGWYRRSWWAWTSTTAASAGHYLEDAEKNGGTRWLTFSVDATHPLGPLAKYRDAARHLRKASKQQRRQAHAMRKAADEGTKRTKKGDVVDVVNGRRTTQPFIGGVRPSSRNEVDAALSVVCAPRFDELSGRYYRPCASVPAAVTTDEATAGGTAEDVTSSSLIFPEFSLMDNVRAIHLAVTLRHETGENGNAAARWHPLRGVTGGAVEEEAAVFHWRVEKALLIHPGGLVETQLRVQTRVWPKGNSIWQRWGPSHGMAALLGGLALLELVLRVRALCRIRRYVRRLGKARLDFHARQMRAADLRRRLGVGPVAPAIPYEWGFPGTPATHCIGGNDRVVVPFPESATPHANYGTLRNAAVDDGEAGRQLQPAAATASLASPPSPPAHTASTPLLARDTSRSIVASPHLLAEREMHRIAADVRSSATAQVPLQRATEPYVDQQQQGPLSMTPPSAALQASFRTPLLGVSLLSPQLTQRIMERSYVDLRTTWRHHLQQSMGTGWHWVGIVAATLTLSYSTLLLLPLLPGVEVAQDGRYDAWSSVLLGTAALTSCVLLLSYLRFFPTLYFPILASTYVLPKLLLFALCVSPLFFGFAVFFEIAFGPYSDGRFNSLDWASMGLYLMTYGDSLLDSVAVLADTPYAVTAFFANVMVITFALLFMMIMLNIAMTITQHEWLRLRRRFGAALSSSSLLFSVRSRAEVKAEAAEAVRANLEVLWFMLAEEEQVLAQEQAAPDAATSSTESGRTSSDEPLRLPPLSGAEVAAPTFTTTTTTATVASSSVDGNARRSAAGWRAGGRGIDLHEHHHYHRTVSRRKGDGNSGGGSEGSQGAATEDSSHDVSVATTAPPE